MKPRVVGRDRFIESVQAPTAAPLFFVRKPGRDGSRLVIDYKAFNKIAIKDESLLPRNLDLIHKGRQFGNKKWALQRGYHHVEIAMERSMENGIQMPLWDVSFLMPFGLAGGPSTNELDKFVVIFLDDV